MRIVIPLWFSCWKICRIFPPVSSSSAPVGASASSRFGRPAIAVRWHCPPESLETSAPSIQTDRIHWSACRQRPEYSKASISRSRSFRWKPENPLAPSPYSRRAAREQLHSSCHTSRHKIFLLLSVLSSNILPKLRGAPGRLGLYIPPARAFPAKRAWPRAGRSAQWFPPCSNRPLFWR